MESNKFKSSDNIRHRRHKGSIKIGKDADIVIIDDACNVETTIKMENIMLSNDLSLVE